MDAVELATLAKSLAQLGLSWVDKNGIALMADKFFLLFIKFLDVECLQVRLRVWPFVR